MVKRKSFICMCIFTLFFLIFVGCAKNFVYPYLYDVTQIVEIKIGIKREESLSDISIDNKYDVKAIIDDKEAFFKDFENLKFNNNFPGDIVDIKPNEYVIIFIYDNGDSEEIHWGAQFKIMAGNGKLGRLHCDERTFMELISRWCTY